MATKKKTPAPSKTVTKDQISELRRLNLKQAEADAQALAAEQAKVEPYVSPEEPKTGSDAAVSEALADAAEAEKIQNQIDTMGVDAYIAKAGATPAQVASLTPQYKSKDGTIFTDYQAYKEYQDYLDGKREARQSAFDLLYDQFSKYGLGSLVQPLRNLITDPSVSPAEFTIKLRESDPYKARFSANAKRQSQGLRVLSEAEYLGLEDSYQQLLRQYGMPSDYYSEVVDPVTGVKTQPNLEKFIAGDISPTELEDRLQLGFNKIINAAPEVTEALKAFYPDITNGDMLAYVLDPKNAIEKLKRKVTAAEIGGAALSADLLGKTPEEIAKNLPGFAERAKELASYGITGSQYGQASPFLSSAAERGGQLASIYKQDEYGRTQAEAEAFNIAGSTEARKQRQKLTGLEQASFSGSSGTSNAISRDRAGTF